MATQTRAKHSQKQNEFDRFYVDPRKKTTVPVRDTYTKGMPIVFLVDVYGWERSDFATIPGGAAPLIAAVKRCGFDPDRYQANIFEAGGIKFEG